MANTNQQTTIYPTERHLCNFFLEKVYRPRPSVSGMEFGFLSPRLAYILRGECTVVFPDGSQMECKEGSVWYIPKNKPYKSLWRSNDYVEFYAIEFELDDISNTYTTFHSIEGTNSVDLFRELFKNKEENNPIGTTCSFYKILDKILPFLKRNDDENIKQILPAINYINEHFSSKIMVNTLANLCFMSESGFYQAFKKATNSSPIEYKNQIKLSHAVRLITNGETLENVCEKLNFTSPSFLRRLIKKHFNITPKHLKNTLISI